MPYIHNGQRGRGHDGAECQDCENCGYNTLFHFLTLLLFIDRFCWNIIHTGDLRSSRLHKNHQLS